jgi:hypothetical protein
MAPSAYVTVVTRTFRTTYWQYLLDTFWTLSQSYRLANLLALTFFSLFRSASLTDSTQSNCVDQTTIRDASFLKTGSVTPQEPDFLLLI